jgi:hypothetical protein
VETGDTEVIIAIGIILGPVLGVETGDGEIFEAIGTILGPRLGAEAGDSVNEAPVAVGSELVIAIGATLGTILEPKGICVGVILTIIGSVIFGSGIICRVNGKNNG